MPSPTPMPLPLGKCVIPGSQGGSREPHSGAESAIPGESRKMSERLLRVLGSSYTTCLASSVTQFPSAFLTFDSIIQFIIQSHVL